MFGKQQWDSAESQMFLHAWPFCEHGLKAFSPSEWRYLERKPNDIMNLVSTEEYYHIKKSLTDADTGGEKKKAIQMRNQRHVSIGYVA